MFIIDSLIGNNNRHNGNWGFLVNKKTNVIKFAPIYDCGSCLNPMLEDSEIEKFDKNDFKNLALNCYSCLKENGQKINYVDYIKKMENDDCNKAITRIFKQINIEKINLFIDNISCLSSIRKNFYKKIINLRYKIIEDVYNILNNRKEEKN